MRISRLCALAVAATLLLAPAAGAFAPDPSSLDARHVAADAAAATNPRPIYRPAVQPTAPQALYYASYGTPTPIPHARSSHDSSPWLALGLALGLTLVAAGAVAFAVRSRGREMRVRVS